MRLFIGSIERMKSGTLRLEDDLTPIIDEFFSNQPNVEKYEIVERKNTKDIISQENELVGIVADLKWAVDVYGDIHLYEDNLINGDLFFKIRMLTGNLYCHCKHIKPSVIPSKLYGDIVFVPDEEEQWKHRQNENTEIVGMECLTAAPTKSQVIKKLEQVFTDYIAGGYDIDLDDIIEKLKDEWNNKNKFTLIVEAKRRQRGILVDCDIYIKGGKDDSPLKLQVIEKAMYLTFMLQEKGIKLEYTTPDFWKTARKIYTQLSGDKAMSETSGIMSDEFMMSDAMSTTINGYRSKIRSEIKKRISNDKIVDDFAVEGYKNKPVFVKKATPEIRNHIREVFDL